MSEKFLSGKLFIVNIMFGVTPVFISLVLPVAEYFWWCIFGTLHRVIIVSLLFIFHYYTASVHDVGNTVWLRVPRSVSKMSGILRCWNSGHPAYVAIEISLLPCCCCCYEWFYLRGLASHCDRVNLTIMVDFDNTWWRVLLESFTHQQSNWTNVNVWEVKYCDCDFCYFSVHLTLSSVRLRQLSGWLTDWVPGWLGQLVIT